MKDKKKMKKKHHLGVDASDFSHNKLRRIKHVVKTWRQQTKDGCCNPNELLQRISNIVDIKA
jgi:hypothetical protein